MDQPDVGRFGIQLLLKQTFAEGCDVGDFDHLDTFGLLSPEFTC
jgi:hypothetical protein